MKCEVLPPLPPECQELQLQLEEWRKGRKKRSRVPEGVWEAAVRLAKKHGAHRISRELRLDYGGLKKRVNGTIRQDVPEEPCEAALLQVNVPESSATFIVEFDNGSGARLKIEVMGGSAGDLLPLAKAFWGR